MMNKFGRRVAKIATSNVNQVSSIVFDLSKLKSYEEIPGPKAYPIVGSMLSLKQLGGDLDIMNFDKFLFQLNERYGDLVKMDLFGQRNVFTFKPEHAKTIYQNEDSSPQRPALTPWVLYAKQKKYTLSLVSSQGEEWKKQRSASNPIVAKPKTIASYLNIHNEITNEYFQSLKNKSESGPIIFDKFEDQIKLLVLEMMSVVAFDHRICLNEKNTSEEAIKLFRQIHKYNKTTLQLYFSVPLWKYIRTPKWIEFEKISDYIYEFTRKYVLEAYEKMKSTKQVKKSETTMLEQFCLNQEKSNLTLEDIVAMMSEFLISSFDTTAATLHFFLTELGTHSGIQEEIYNEIKEAYPKDEYIDTDFFTKIPLLKAAIKESQRLHSIVPSGTRILSVDIVLDNYLIPKGTVLNIGLVNMCYMEKYYKDATKFNPKRWLKGKRNSQYDPYTNLPFGFGARQCIGRRLAEQKMYLILSKLIKNYKIEYLGDNKPSKFRIMKVPGNDLKLKLTPRSN